MLTEKSSENQPNQINLKVRNKLSTSLFSAKHVIVYGIDGFSKGLYESVLSFGSFSLAKK